MSQQPLPDVGSRVYIPPRTTPGHERAGFSGVVVQIFNANEQGHRQVSLAECNGYPSQYAMVWLHHISGFSNPINEGRTPTKTALTPEQRAAGEKHYRDTMTPENRPLRDDVITSHHHGMILAGFKIIQTPGGCDTLSQCPDCKSNYRTLYDSPNDGQQWACPICNTLTPAN